MRSRVALLALVLLALTVASPALEAVAGCLEPCPDETPGQDACPADACCSCCVHTGPLSSPVTIPQPRLEPLGATHPPAAASAPSTEAFDILHVPKSLPS
jgi:hypothetical protein